jgi:hypothetical protein
MRTISALLWTACLTLARAEFIKMPKSDGAAHGNIYLPLTNFSNSIIEEARQNVTNQIEQAIAAGDSKYGPITDDTSFSATVFSLKTGEAIFGYHYEAPKLGKESYTKGKLSDSTIYRTGSIGKLLTMYTWLVDLGDWMYYDPITKFVVCIHFILLRFDMRS